MTSGLTVTFAAGLAALALAGLADVGLVGQAHRERPGRPSARELSARELSARELSARELSARWLVARGMVARWLVALPYLLGAAGSGCLTAAGAGAIAGGAIRLPVAGWLAGGGPGAGWLGGTAALSADRLSGLFLVIAFGAAVPVSLAFAGWAARPDVRGRPGLGWRYALALGAVAVILTARDAFTLLFAWELLTVAFYLIAGFERDRPGRPGGALVTLAFGKISGAALLLGLLLLAARSGSGDLASFAHVHGTARTAAQVLLVVGFAVKVGMVPFQVWLPRGYAAAPGPARAVMGGVAVNVGFYGLWRTLALLGAPPGWLTGTLLLLAGLTALLGIAHAAVQPRLHRVIAYSSVENSGLILAGYGVALVGAAIGNGQLAAVGLLAATLQVVAHTAAKSLLFTSGAIITAGDQAVAPGADDVIDELRGSAVRRPWSGTGLAIGSLTLAGLPLTIGFVSEWFLLEALMQQFRVPALGYRLALVAAGAAVALTAGFAGVTFVRLIGFVVLGPPAVRDEARSAESARPWDGGPLGKAAIAVLCAGCLAVTALVPLLIRMLAAGLSGVVPGQAVDAARQSPWVLGPVFGGFSVLSPSWLWIMMPLLAAVVLAVTFAASGTRMLRVRRVPAWRSATAGVQGADSYTATGFANPTRRVLAAVLHTRSAVTPLHAAGAGGGAAGEPAHGHGQARAHAPGAHLGYSSDVIEVVEDYLYRPAARPVMAAVALAKRLQSGRLDAYLGYLLIALVAVLALATALA